MVDKRLLLADKNSVIIIMIKKMKVLSEGEGERRREMRKVEMLFSSETCL